MRSRSGCRPARVFFNPASASVLPFIVDEQELVAASSGLWSAAVVSQIALAPLGGALVAALGVAPAFGLNAASFAISATILTALHPAGAQRLAGAGSWIRRIRDGTRLLAADRLLRPLAAVQLLAALSAGATSALLVILAERHLGTGSDGFGLLLGAIGVGAALGPLLLARLTSNPAARRWCSALPAARHRGCHPGYHPEPACCPPPAAAGCSPGST